MALLPAASSGNKAAPSAAAGWRLCSDVLLQPDAERERFLLFNPFVRSHVETDEEGLQLVSFCLRPRTEREIEAFVRNASSPLFFRDRTLFSNGKGLMADPSNLSRGEGASSGERPTAQPEEILRLLRDRWILISDEQEYLEIFGPKKNIFDNKHLGNFHQQLGVELRVKQRVDPDRWWLAQKFSEEKDELRPNLYRYIQLHFWEDYFGAVDLNGKKALDVGCGPGFYSRFLARRGAAVLGIDPNPVFIDLATRRGSGERLPVEYRVEEIGTGEAFRAIPDESFDFIIFQDALLFYFVPYDGAKPADRKKVLDELRRVLRKDGRLLVIEPHGLFWLSPWMGSVERPFTVLTEYALKGRGVTPSLSQMTGAFCESGLRIRRIFEPQPSAEARQADPRAYGFASQFPLWWCFELEK